MAERALGLAVRAVIRDKEGRCLLLRRSKLCKSFTGKWEWPGGKVDPGESFDQALHREIREETGLLVELTGVVGAFGMELTKIRAVVLCLEGVVTGGSLKTSDEHDDHAWVSVAEMLSWDLSEPLRKLAAEYVAACSRA